EPALAKARELRPGLVVLDVRLPGPDGLQVLSELKGDPATAQVPVVVVTVDEPDFPTDGLGVCGFFVKPVESEAFLRRLRELQPGLFPGDRATRGGAETAALGQGGAAGNPKSETRNPKQIPNPKTQ